MKELILLFGKSFAGGQLMLKNSSYGNMSYFTPDDSYSKNKKLKDIKFEKCNLSVIKRLIITFTFLNNKKFSKIYLTHSIQALIFPILFRSTDFIWICQGVEILTTPFKYKFRLFFFNILSIYSNLTISTVNPLLHKFVGELYKGNLISDKNIEILPSSNDNLCFDKKGRKKVFAFLRDDECKNSNLIIKLINDRILSNVEWVILDLRKDKIGLLPNNNHNILEYYDCYLEHNEVINLLATTDYLIYPSFFEGFGLLVNEAIEKNVIPMIGPLCLFKEHKNVLLINNYKYITWQSALL